jgi:adenylate cyclase
MASTRRLTAILAADVAGYSRLIGTDEEGTLNRLKALVAELIDPTVAKHHGRIVKTTGDGLLVEFASVVDGLRCATEWQRGMAERNILLLSDDRIEFRIGINVGDVVVEDGDIFGDGVNVAARLENLAEPGGICVSARVQEDAAGKLYLAFEDMGEQTLKNIARPVRVYRLLLGTPASTPKGPSNDTGPVLALPDKPSIAVLPFANMSNDAEQEFFGDGIAEGVPLTGDRGFESLSLQRRVRCEPDFLRFRGRLEKMLSSTGGPRVRIQARPSSASAVPASAPKHHAWSSSRGNRGSHL